MKKRNMFWGMILLILCFAILQAGCAQRNNSATPSAPSAPSAPEAPTATSQASPAAGDVSADNSPACDDNACKIPDGEGTKEDKFVSINSEGTSYEVKSKGENEGEITIRDKNGEYKQSVTKKVNENNFAVKFYPKAEIETGTSVSSESAENKNATVHMVKLVTKDSPEDVKKFYEKQLKKPTVTSLPDGKVIMTQVDPDNDEKSINIFIEKQENQTVIAITQTGGK